MKTYCGGVNFKALYYQFVTRDSKGKLFVMEDYNAESIEIGAGATIYIEKATGFLLHILKEWHDQKPHVLIGDIELFLNTVSQRKQQRIHDKIQNDKQKFESKPRLVLQLHNILRTHEAIDKKPKASKQRQK